MTFQRREAQGSGKHALIFVAQRVGAFWLDALILFAVLGPSGFLVQRLIGHQPQTGVAIWSTILLNFSLPSWLYFMLSDWSAGGATLGKRLFKLRVTDVFGKRLGFGRALGRTAVKLLPWELIHISAFALSTDISQLSLRQSIGLTVASVLAFIYIILAVITRGRRSVHDFFAGTEVRPVRKAA